MVNGRDHITKSNHGSADEGESCGLRRVIFTMVLSESYHVMCLLPTELSTPRL